MIWAMREEFRESYRKARLITNRLQKYKDACEMIRTADIIDAVEEELNIDVKFTTFDFSEFAAGNDKNRKFLDRFGAAMYVSEGKNNKKNANILLNQKESPEMQRFSLVHELGHLMMQDLSNINGYKISTHIDMDITSIPEELLDKKENSFLIEEQQANIFALLVLIPYDMLKGVLMEKDSLEETAKFFGVEKSAIVSRMALGDEMRNIDRDE